MKKLILAAIVAAFAVAGPAQAHRSGDDRGASADRASQSDNPSQGTERSEARGENGKPKSGDRGSERRARRCTPRRVGYLASGLYVSSELTQTKGAETADNPRDDRYSGTLKVMVKRGNNAAKADKGTEKTYTLVDAKVRFADRDDNGTRDQPVAGDRTFVQGKTTKLRRGCDATGFTPELKIKKVWFLDPPQAPAPPPAPAP